MYPVQSFGILTRRPDLSRAQFRAHWCDVHGPLGLRTLPLVRQYVQNYAMDEGLSGILLATCDGVAETWFAALSDALSLPTSPEYRNGLYLDEPNFMAGGTTFLITEEHPVIGGSRLPREADTSKALIFLRRAGGSTIQEFRDRWQRIHSSAAFSGPWRPLRYTRCVVTDECHQMIGPPFDGVAEIWWASSSARRQSWDAAPMRDLFTSALCEAVDFKASCGLVVEEGRLLWP